MKRLFLCGLFVCMASTIAGGYYTADECRAKAKAGDTVRLKIAYLEAMDDGGKDILDGLVLMWAHTHDGREDWGGLIQVAVPEKLVAKFARKVGVKADYRKSGTVKTTTVRCKVRVYEKDDGGEIMYVEIPSPSKKR